MNNLDIFKKYSILKSKLKREEERLHRLTDAALRISPHMEYCGGGTLGDGRISKIAVEIADVKVEIGSIKSAMALYRREILKVINGYASERDKDILKLKFIDGLSYTEIARRTAQNKESVRWRIRRFIKMSKGEN